MVKTTMALLLLICLPLTLATAQTVITGTVIDEQTNDLLPGVEVSLLTTTVTTDAFGTFEMNVIASEGEYKLTIAREGYAVFLEDVTITGSSNIDLGTIAMSGSGGFDASITDELIPTISLSAEDLDGGGGSQNISGVLTASRDAFVNAAAFTFGSARFNIRGYNAKYTSLLINGMPINDLETGRVSWNHWGGLNDVLRNRTNIIGLGASTFSYGGIGGASIIDTRASNQRKQLRVGYASSNRSYTSRLMATYSTGLLESGWAFSFSASRRWADEGYIEGTFYDAYSYFASVDRVLGDNATLNLTVFGAPVKRGKLSGAIQEVYDLAGTNYYNANWGFQEGKKRNSRVRNEHQPIVMLRNDWNITDKLQLTTTIGHQTGFTGNSALDWYDAPDPRPTYYRKLPSFFEGAQAQAVADLWATDPSVSQVNWDQIYQINYNNFETIENADGIEGNTVSGRRSQYVVEDRRTDITRTSANTILEFFVNDHLTIQFGATYQQQQTENFKVVEDFLGGDFYINIDRFAEFDST
ncbi:MAG: TonB-dependent receptor, partial [Bacteroidota bacterium]